MRRQDIQLLASARQGDPAARCEVARRYLCGADGFPLHVGTGLEYLAHPAVKDLPRAAALIAECLPLEKILEAGVEPALRRAAAAGHALAQAKLAAWELLRQAADADVSQLLTALDAAGEPDAEALCLRAARVAAAAGEAAVLATCIACVHALQERLSDEVAELVGELVRRAEAAPHALRRLPPQLIHDGLERRALQGDAWTAHALGLALCGITAGPLPAWVFTGAHNQRQGVAFLLRAADAGHEDAWLHLYRLMSDHRLSVANPKMARFFLEKAADKGHAEARRKLGALILREATSLADSERAIGLLHGAAGQGDGAAHALLRSLVLPVEGAAAPAWMAIERIRRDDPLLAARLELARRFGLTKLEALSIDPAAAWRPWGLAVGRNPFITKSRLSAPRAVPAVDTAASEAAQRAATLFDSARRGAAAADGDLRRRSTQLRRVLERLDVEESMFFAQASSRMLDALRQGPKWAFRAREPLALALAR
jgi:TPR repeat protein